MYGCRHWQLVFRSVKQCIRADTSDYLWCDYPIDCREKSVVSQTAYPAQSIFAGYFVTGRSDPRNVCLRRGAACCLCSTGIKREGRIPRNPCTGMGGVKFYTSGITGTAGRFYRGKYQVNFNQYYSFVYGDLVGKKLVKKVSQKVFLNLTYVLLLVSGLSLIL